MPTPEEIANLLGKRYFLNFGGPIDLLNEFLSKINPIDLSFNNSDEMGDCVIEEDSLEIIKAICDSNVVHAGEGMLSQYTYRPKEKRRESVENDDIISNIGTKWGGHNPGVWMSVWNYIINDSHLNARWYKKAKRNGVEIKPSLKEQRKIAADIAGISEEDRCYDCEGETENAFQCRECGLKYCGYCADYDGGGCLDCQGQLFNFS